ncbi:MAG TPA: penicillin acylase family protein, partial [Gemmatimonadales bacterium]|nr:penicillin acylase family protein [Gemmatimonadales bacterium]
MRLPRFFLWAAAAAVILVLSGHPLGPLPPIGRFLDPATGIWSVAHQAAPLQDATLHLPSLTAPVEVAVDHRGVPQIFAASDRDAWRALGWLHARDRLFQLDLQTRATEGTLTEWVGPAALSLDRDMRTLGLARLADSLWQALPDTSLTRAALTAYAEGVNARIASLGARDLPFEYHLISTRPRPWRPEYSLYLAERMTYTLTWQETDLQREALATMVGDRAAAALLPAVAPLQEPVVPDPRGLRPLVVDLPPPGPRRVAPPPRVGAIADAAINDLQAGSNNWAIAPARSADHHALLAGDPHLDLTLPSVWYEAHLVSADGLDIYGATLPGAPAVLIGLTPGVAWSFTNSEADFVDHYREAVNDSVHPTAHLVDGAWRPVAERVERYLGRRGETLAVDTLYRTARGPLRRYAGGWRSLRWTGLEARDPIGAFVRLQRARSVGDFLVALAVLEAPSQNGVAADTAGHIAELTAGRYPRRPNNDGGTIFDGTSSASDWRGDLPPLRAVLDPPRGTLFSANEQGVDPRVDPAYRGNGWAAPWRAMRIARLSAAAGQVTPDLMRRWQTDPISERALWWTPAIVAATAGESSLAAPRALLAGWQDGYRPSSRAAALFEVTMEQVAQLTWDEVAVKGRVVAWPSATVLAALRDRPDDIWWDRRDTPARERRDDILREALARAWDRLVRAPGFGPDTTRWRWDRHQTAQVPHIAFF